MGKRGPQPLTAEQLAARGSARAKRRAEAEAAAPAEDSRPYELRTPKKPSWLTGTAAKKWREVIPVLQSMQVLTDADVDTVARYCQTWQTWLEAEQTLRKDGLTMQGERGGLKRHPAIAIRREMGLVLQALSDRLGLNPSRRQLMKVAAIYNRPGTKPTQAPTKPAEDGTPKAPVGGEAFFRRLGK